jgi:hypothetical protein
VRLLPPCPGASAATCPRSARPGPQLSAPAGPCAGPPATVPTATRAWPTPSPAFPTPSATPSVPTSSAPPWRQPPSRTRPELHPPHRRGHHRRRGGPAGHHPAVLRVPGREVQGTRSAILPLADLMPPVPPSADAPVTRGLCPPPPHPGRCPARRLAGAEARKTRFVRYKKLLNFSERTRGRAIPSTVSWHERRRGLPLGCLGLPALPGEGQASRRMPGGVGERGALALVGGSSPRWPPAPQPGVGQALRYRPPSQTGGRVAPSRWPGPPRHARAPHGELRALAMIT